MRADLSGQVVFLTGAAGGIGRAAGIGHGEYGFVRARFNRIDIRLDLVLPEVGHILRGVGRLIKIGQGAVGIAAGRHGAVQHVIGQVRTDFVTGRAGGREPRERAGTVVVKRPAETGGFQRRAARRQAVVLRITGCAGLAAQPGARRDITCALQGR